MNEIAFSEKEKQALTYQMAWIRTRNFSIENDQPIIREFFKKLFLYEASKPQKSLLLLFERTVFIVEKEDTDSEKVIFKASDYPLMAMFFSEYIGYLEAGNPRINPHNRFITKSIMEILNKGFSTLLLEKILNERYLSKFDLTDQKKFVSSLESLIVKMVEHAVNPSTATALKKVLREIKSLNKTELDLWHQLKLEQAAKVAQAAQIENEKISMEVSPVFVAPKKEVKKKPVSAWGKKELKLEFSKIANATSELSEEEQLKVVVYIAKKSERSSELVDRRDSLFFVQKCLDENIPLVIDSTSNLFRNLTDFLTPKVKELKTTSKLDERLKNYYFNREQFDWQELAEDLLDSFERNSLEQVEFLLANSKHNSPLDGYYTIDNPFRFQNNAEERALLNFFLNMSVRKFTVDVLIQNGEVSFPNKDYLDLVGINKEGFYVPASSKDWNLYLKYIRFTMEFLITEDLELSPKHYELSKKYLSLLSTYETTNLYSDILTAYKVQNFEFTEAELVSFVSKAFNKANNSYNVNENSQKLLFNKKISNHLLLNISGMYSKMSDSNKGFVFSRINEGTLMQWMETLDPVLLNVATLMPNSLADNVTSLLEEMQHFVEIKKGFSQRVNPQYD